MTLTLKIDIFFPMARQLLIIHHHTKFGYKRLSGSGNLAWTKIWTPWTNIPPTPKLFSFFFGGGGGWYNERKPLCVAVTAYTIFLSIFAGLGVKPNQMDTCIYTCIIIHHSCPSCLFSPVQNLLLLILVLRGAETTSCTWCGTSRTAFLKPLLPNIEPWFPAKNKHNFFCDYNYKKPLLYNNHDTITWTSSQIK